MHLPIKYAGGILGTLLLVTCEVINPDEEVPSYLHIAAIDLSTNYSQEGAASHNIVDAWVFVGGDLVGIYELPATLPVLKKGTQEILVKAGIKRDGISSTRITYPFYRAYRTKRDLSSLHIDTLVPTVRYYSDTVINIVWQEPFESGVSLEPTSESASVTRKRNTAYKYSNGWVGEVQLTSSNDLFKAHSLEAFGVPQTNNREQEVYLELDYQCETDLKVGISVGSQTVYKVGLRPTDWNKVYVNLTNYARQANSSFRVTLKASLPDSLSESTLYLDNLKLLYFRP